MSHKWIVTYGEDFLRSVADSFPDERTGDSTGMTFGEFMAGPVRAARLLFEAQWDQLPPDAGAAVRVAHLFSQQAGPLVFYGVLVGPRNVEIAGFDQDPDYWNLIEGDPED